MAQTSPRFCVFNRAESIQGLWFQKPLVTRNHAFAECLYLNNLNLPKNITVLEPYTFYKCQQLQWISLSNITSFGDGCFLGSGITEVDFGKYTKSLGRYLFGCRPNGPGCDSRDFIDSKITCIMVEAAYPPACSYETFDGINVRDCTLIVPFGSADLYSKQPGWNLFKKVIEMNF